MTEIVTKIYQNQAMINRICFSFCQSEVDREDLFQEIIYRILRSYPTFNNRSEFSTWLYRVALNTALTYSKKRKREKIGIEVGQASWDPSHTEDKKTEIEVLYRAIGKLPRIERGIIFLYLEEMSYDEIAGITGFTTKNISVKIHRIKKKLHEIYLTLI